MFLKISDDGGGIERESPHGSQTTARTRVTTRSSRAGGRLSIVAVLGENNMYEIMIMKIVLHPCGA